MAKRGGRIAGNARRDLEQELGRPAITAKNAAQLNHMVTAMIEASAAIEETAEDAASPAE